MPDVGLFTATEPLPKEAKVVIKYSVEVEGLAVYQESYDVDSLTAELESSEERAAKLWLRRLKAPVLCRKAHGFSAALTRAIASGECCENAVDQAFICKIDDLGTPTA